NPGFSKQYTEETIYENSLIIVNGEVFEYVAYNDIYLYDFSTYYYDGNYTVDFDGERAITRAIDYITNEQLPVMYYLTGHGEAEFSEDRIRSVNRQNILVNELSLISAGKVPEDAGCVFIFNPSADISDTEKDMLLHYLNNGGNILVYTDFVAFAYRNLTEVLRHFGVSPDSGIVFDSDPDHCALGYIYYLLPDIAEHPITAPLLLHNYRVISPLAHVIDTSGTANARLSAVKLLTTSEMSYAKTYENSESFDKEDGDAEGPFTVGVAVTADTGANNESRLVWYSSGSMMSETADSIVAGANQDIFINSVGWLCQKESAISIHSKSLDTAHLRVSSAAVNQLGLLFIGVIPLVFIIMGIVVFIRRRRK
ncbi:MAG: GldG family protein, partial [Oscillospiraceae bacterium]|nr:GldG family protein [Oscillospiraceae bacterium]